MSAQRAFFVLFKSDPRLFYFTFFVMLNRKTATLRRRPPFFTCNVKSNVNCNKPWRKTVWTTVQSLLSLLVCNVRCNFQCMSQELRAGLTFCSVVMPDVMLRAILGAEPNLTNGTYRILYIRNETLRRVFLTFCGRFKMSHAVSQNGFLFSSRHLRPVTFGRKTRANLACGLKYDSFHIVIHGL